MSTFKTAVPVDSEVEPSVDDEVPVRPSLNRWDTLPLDSLWSVNDNGRHLPPTAPGGASMPHPRPQTPASVEAVASVVLGAADCVYVPGAVPTPWCGTVANLFNSSPLPSQRNDGVPGRELGVSAFGKEPERYFELVYEQRGALEQLLGGPKNPWRQFLRELGAELGQHGYRLRPAQFLGEVASSGRLVKWQFDMPGSAYLLKLHEDCQQVRAAINGAFEIRTALRVIALNLYVCAHPGSGQLQVSDWRLTDEECKRLGVTDTGYPIPAEAIPADRTLRTFDLSSGDLIAMDGSLVHGVIAGEGRVGDRLLLNLFLGVLPNRDVVMWA